MFPFADTTSFLTLIGVGIIIVSLLRFGMKLILRSGPASFFWHS